MNSIRSIVKNSGASLLAQISTPAASFLLVFLIARFLGVSGVGTFSSAFAVLYMFEAFACLGFQYLITREVAQDRSKAGELLVNASFLGLVAATFLAVIMGVVYHVITDSPDLIHCGYLLSLSLIPLTLGLVSQSISRGFERLEDVALSTVAGNVFKFVFGAIFLLLGYGLLHVMAAILVGNVLMFVISFCLAKRCIPEHTKMLEIRCHSCEWILGSSAVFALIFAFGGVRQNIDILILTRLMGEREVGFYSAAFKLVHIGTLGISFYIMAIQPVIFRLFKSSPEKFQTVSSDSVRYFFILILPIIAGATLLGDKVILLIFGQDFLPSTHALSILIWLVILTGFNQIFTNVLVASNAQKINLFGNILSMVCNIVLNVLLIPKMSYIGAAIANVASALIILLYQQKFVSNHLFKVNYFSLAKKPFLASVVMGGFVLILREVPFLFLAAIFVAGYGVTLLLLKTFSQTDINRLRRLFKGGSSKLRGVEQP